MAYEGLISIYQEAVEEYLLYKNTPPKDCPNDGTTLMENENGVLTCRWDGWQYLGYNH